MDKFISIVKVALERPITARRDQDQGGCSSNRLRSHSMSDKPTLARDVYDRYVVNDTEVSWPAASAERTALARALLGRQFVHSLDYWLDHARDLINNREPEKSFQR